MEQPRWGEKDVEIEADFSMSILTDDSGKAEQIEEVRFTNDKSSGSTSRTTTIT